MAVLESTIQKQIVAYLKKKGYWAIKIHLASVSGWPDLLVIGKNKVLFIEVKAPGKKARKLQVFVHNKLRALGQEVIIADSVETVKYYIENE